MKLNIIILFFITTAIFACGNKQSEPQKETPKETSTQAPTEQPKTETPPANEKPHQCYSYIGNRDTIFMQITEEYGMMTGLLMYNRYQKDKNLGTIQGKMIGDVLLADYSFKSEGKLSVRQVAFKKKGSDFVEGYGDIVEVNGKTVFKNVPGLKFNDAMALKSVPCKQ